MSKDQKPVRLSEVAMLPPVWFLYIISDRDNEPYHTEAHLYEQPPSPWFFISPRLLTRG